MHDLKEVKLLSSNTDEVSCDKIVFIESNPAPEGLWYLKSDCEEPELGLVGVILKDNSQFSVSKKVMKRTGDDPVIPACKRIGLMILLSDHDFTIWPGILFR